MLTHQTVELNGKRYDVGLLGDRVATIRVETKRGWRTLGGYGRALRRDEWNAVCAAIERSQQERQITECLQCGDPNKYPQCPCGTAHSQGYLAGDIH